MGLVIVFRITLTIDAMIPYKLILLDACQLLGILGGNEIVKFNLKLNSLYFIGTSVMMLHDKVLFIQMRSIKCNVNQMDSKSFQFYALTWQLFETAQLPTLKNEQKCKIADKTK